MGKEEIELNVRMLLDDILDEEVEVQKISSDEKLNECGMNSLAAVKVIVKTENFFGFEFNDEDLIPGNFETISKLVNYIQSRLCVQA